MSCVDRVSDFRIVPELEILTTFLDLTLNFVTLIGRPQWNGRFFWQASLFHLPPKFSVRSRSKVTGTEFGNCTSVNKPKTTRVGFE